MHGSRHFHRKLVRSVSFAVEAMERRTLLAASFANPVNYSTGHFPLDLVVADLNADGRPDIATVDTVGKNLSVRYSNANGTFGSKTNLPTGLDRPTGISAGDVDGDSDIDLVVSDGDGPYRVFLNGPGGGTTRTFTGSATVNINTAIFENELVDMNGDGKLDLVVGDSPLYTLLGAGDGTFSTTLSAVPLAAGDVVSLGIGDFDGVGLPDIVAGIAGPSFTSGPRQHRVVIVNNFFPSGGSTQTIDTVPVLPSDLTTGDFNEDGKLDFVVAGYSGGVGNFAPVLQYYQNDGSGGFPTTGVAVFNPTSTTPAIKAADFDGDGNLDLAVITNGNNPSVDDTLEIIAGNGDGTFATTSTAFSTGENPTRIAVADFNADSKPDLAVIDSSDNSFSIRLNNTGGGGTPTPTVPDLSATFGTVTLPAVFVPGDTGSAQVVIANAGGVAKGKVNVAIYASTDGAIDGGDTLLDTGTTLANKSVNIRTDKTAKLTGKFVAPAALANGTYFLLAQVTPVAIDGVTDTFAAASTGTFEKVTRFGQVGDRKNVKLVSTDSDGTLISYGISGPGTGTLSTSGIDNSDVTLTLDGTTIKSKFAPSLKTARTNPGSDAQTTITTLIVNGPLSAIAGKGLNVANSVSVGDIKSIVLEDLLVVDNDVAITLTGTTPVALTFGQVFNANITSTAPIKSLKAALWADDVFGDDTITAPFLTTLTVAGAFDANLLLSGAGAPNGTTLSSAKIGGNLDGSFWSVATGNVGTIAVGGNVGFDWVGNFAGILKSITTKGNFGGDLVAGTINAFAVTGDVFAGLVRAGGTFGADNDPGTGDDTFAVGTLKKITVKGDVTGSRFLAGVDASDTAQAGGVLGSVTISGPVDAATRFVAETLPPTARIDGERIDTALGDRFLSLAL